MYRGAGVGEFLSAAKDVIRPVSLHLLKGMSDPALIISSFPSFITQNQLVFPFMTIYLAMPHPQRNLSTRKSTECRYPQPSLDDRLESLWVLMNNLTLRQWIVVVLTHAVVGAMVLSLLWLLAFKARLPSAVVTPQNTEVEHHNHLAPVPQEWQTNEKHKGILDESPNPEPSRNDAEAGPVLGLPDVLNDKDDFGEGLRNRLLLCSSEPQGLWAEEVLKSGLALMDEERGQGLSDEHKSPQEEFSISSSSATWLSNGSKTVIFTSYHFPISTHSKKPHDNVENDDSSNGTFSETATKPPSSSTPPRHLLSYDSMSSEIVVLQTPDRKISAGLGWLSLSEGRTSWISSKRGLGRDLCEGGFGNPRDQAEHVNMKLVIRQGIERQGLPGSIEKVLQEVVDSW